MTQKNQENAQATGDNNCEECGKPTINPRFCGRSCAAKYNNRKSPKRSPEGKCKTCDTPIPTSRTYCPGCLQAQRDEAEKARQRPSVYFNQRTVFSFLFQPLSAQTIGTFLDLFESIAEQQPPYLQANDWQHYLDIVQILKRSVCPHYGPGMNREDIAAVDFSLERLEYVLRNWVESVTYSRNSHPLAPTIALDTATVLHAHAYGQNCHLGGKNAFELQAVVSGEGRRGEIADQRLKKEITERTISRMHVIARFPEGTTASVHGQPIAIESSEICFLPFRCHQSSSRNEDYEVVIETDKPQFDLSPDFEFLGQFLIAYDKAIPKETGIGGITNPNLPYRVQQKVALLVAISPLAGSHTAATTTSKSME